jgi:opacity protein-like surface antigen
MNTGNFRSALPSQLASATSSLATSFAFVVLSSSIAFIATPASAQQSPVYMSGAVGQSDWGNADFGARSTGGRELSYGLDLGYRINNLVAVELGFSDFGKAKVDPAWNTELNARAISASAVLSYPVADRISLFGQLGAARTRRTVDTDFQEGSQPSTGNPTLVTGRVSFRENKTEAIYGVGASYAISNDAKVFARFQKLGDTKVEAWQIGTSFNF